MNEKIMGKLEPALATCTSSSGRQTRRTMSLEELEEGVEELRQELRKHRVETEVNLEKRVSDVRDQLRAEFALQSWEYTKRGEQQWRATPAADAFEAGQIAFAFMNLARDVVLGKKHPPGPRNDFATLQDLDAYTSEVDHGSRKNYDLLMSTLRTPKVDAMVLRDLQTMERMNPAHSHCHIANLPMDKLRDILSEHLNEKTADAFLADLESLRKLHTKMATSPQHRNP